MKKQSFKQENSHHSKGISLISLIITIIVIIILAAIVIFTGLNTPDRANYAKYTQEVDNLQSAVQDAYSKKLVSYATEKKYRNEKQIYYSIAIGSKVKYVVGAPSLEMMMDSYNAHYGLTGDAPVSGAPSAGTRKNYSISLHQKEMDIK